ncbi:MAG: cytochrome c oxidase assembly protein, partial [Pseudomonadota bacterium]
MRPPIHRRKFITAALLAGLVGAMVGLAYAAVPLYQLFCQVTGYAGATQTSKTAPEAATDRDVTIRFNAEVSGDLSWSFQPVEPQVVIKVGEEHLAYYRVRNLSDRRLVGTATYNVTPFAAGPYFDKVQCFCFEEQALEPGESADLPVSFYVDPAMLEDPETADIRTITLSYTFFRANDDATPP